MLTMTVHFAHSIEDSLSTSGWERLEDHLSAVAALAAGFGDRFEAAGWTELTGRWHDIGKYRPGFQERIRGKQIQAPHAAAGAALVYQRDQRSGLPLAFAIAGHHAGLPNLTSSDTGPTSLKDVLAGATNLANQVESLADEAVHSATVPPLPEWLLGGTHPLGVGQV